MRILWEEDLLSATVLPEQRRFVLGEWPADFVMAREILGIEWLPLVSWDGGRPYVLLPPTAHSASVQRCGQTCDAANPPYRASAERRRFVLELGEAVTFNVAAFRIEVVCEPAVGVRHLRHVAVRLRGLFAGVVTLCQLLFVAAAAYAMPTDQGSPIRLTPSRSVTAVTLPRLVFAQAVAELEPPSPELTGAETPHLWNVDGVDCRCKCSGPLPVGGSRPAADRGRHAVMGPKDNPDPHIARSEATVEASPGWFFGDSYAPGDPRAPTMPWGRDTSLGTDDVSARGAMFGASAGPAPGGDNVPPPRVVGGLRKVLTFAGVAPLRGAHPTGPPTERPRRVRGRRKLRWQDLEPCARTRVRQRAASKPRCESRAW